MHFHRPLKKADFPTAMTFWRLMDLQTDNDTFLFEKYQFPLMTEVMSSLCGDSANKKSLLHSKWSQLSVKNWQYLCHVQRSCDCVTTCYFFNRLHIYMRLQGESGSCQRLRHSSDGRSRVETLPGQHIWTPAVHLFCTAHALLLLISHNLTFTSV